MRIGIVGTRGIPNAYGGFEELAEHLSVLLAKKGHEVFVYCSHNHNYQETTFNGVELLHKFDPEFMLGTAGQFLYDLKCILDSRKRKFDIILQLGYTSSSVWWRLLPKKTRVLTNMDGLEWKRSKYNKLTQRFLKYAEKLAAKHSHLLIADNIEIEKYLSEKYKNQKVFIPYGAHIPVGFMASALSGYQLKEKEYYLTIARLEPENNIEPIILGVINSKSKKPLVIVGKTKTKYGQRMVKKYASKKIIFLDAIYDKEVLNSLRYYSSIYFHGHSVGGTNPALLEAMACQCFIVAHQNRFNQSTLHSNAHFFENAKNLTRIVNEFSLGEPELLFIKSNLSLIRDQYKWKSIIEQYEITMEQLAIG